MPKGPKCQFLGTVLVQFSGILEVYLRLLFRMLEAAGVLLPFSILILAHISGGGGESARASFLPPNFRRCIQMAHDAESCDQRK